MIKKIFKSWTLPGVMAIGLFLFARPILAEQAESESAFLQYLATGNVFVATEIKDGYMQVYYEYEGEKHQISSGNTNYRQPSARGEYITYVGDLNEKGQIFLYHIPTKVNIKLTNSGVNLKPKVSKEGRVVWEKWVGDRWQIYYFDGSVIRQITQGDLATNADIDGEFITYARRDLTNTWRAEVYSIREDESKDVRTGIGTKRPKLNQGEILLTDEESGKVENFSLSAEDMFTLELEPLVLNKGNITEEEILKEIRSVSQESSVDTASDSAGVR